MSHSSTPEIGLQYLDLLMRELPSLVCVFRGTSEVIRLSRHHGQLAGSPRDLGSVSQLSEIYPVEIVRMLKFLAPGEWVHAELSHKDGSLHHYRMALFASENDEQVLLGMVADEQNKDAQLQQYKNQGHHLIYNDGLTGLANRTLFNDRLDKAIAMAKRKSGDFAILLIDLNRFKDFNDVHGVGAGDLYLSFVADKMAEAVRDLDTVARIGDDEFIVILDDVKVASHIESVATKVLQGATSEMELEGKKMSCEASMGISLFPKDGHDAESLLRHADAAMIKAKSSGKTELQFYIKVMTEHATNYLLLENDLRQAINQGQIRLFYQPQLDTRSRRCCGLEVLVRWQHPHRGLLQPGQFIGLAEDSGLIHELGTWTLRESCRRFMVWKNQGIDFEKVAVNVSARQFRGVDFHGLIAGLLHESGMAAKNLEIELTESSTMESEVHATAVLNKLHKMGVFIALDDFGTGYSSLAHLRRFPISKLKIDKSFVRNIDHDHLAAATAKSIIDLSRNMGLQVIAEGVERKGQLNWLRARGCELVQGYYYAPPMEEHDLMAWRAAKIAG